MPDPKDHQPRRPGSFNGRKTKPGSMLPKITPAKPSKRKAGPGDGGMDHEVKQKGTGR